jgi:predicted nucleotidyltransferase
VTGDESLPPRAPDLGKLLGPLVLHGVDFVLIGGMAGIAHGSNYPSFDLDVLYARDRANVGRLVAALAELEVRLRGAPDDLSFMLDERTIENGVNFTFITPHGDLDVLGDVAGVKAYRAVADPAEEKDIAGFSVKIASVDDLIAMKRAAGRPKDKLMVEEYIVIADEQKKLAKEEKERGGG